MEDLVDGLGGQASAVGAGARHGVEAVGDGQDPGGQRDRLAGQAAGVAGAVVVLVVVGHAGQEVVELLEVLEDVHADLDVRLDRPVFLGRQRLGLLEHHVVDADLADVVEQAHQVEVAPLVGREAELLAQPDGDPRDPLGVARGIRVLGVDRRGQGPDHAEEQFLQLAVELAVGPLGADQRGDRLDQLDVGGGEGAVVDRVDGDDPADRRRARRRRRRPPAGPATRSAVSPSLARKMPSPPSGRDQRAEVARRSSP